MNDQDKIELLKNILLEDDRKVRDQIDSRIQELNHQLNERIELEKKIKPIVSDQLEEFQESIPETMGPAITNALKNQIANAKDDIVDALYPIMGQMIKKYIQAEFQKLGEKIERQRKSVFSFKGWKNKFKNWFSGVKESDSVLNDLSESKIIDILVMEEGSGLLIGSLKADETVENELVSGMLTAIKSFIEDAFKKSNEDLEVIEYETYKLIINDFPKFNVVSVIEGPVTASFRSFLDDQINIFASNLTSDTKLGEDLEPKEDLKPFIPSDLHQLFGTREVLLN